MRIWHILGLFTLISLPLAGCGGEGSPPATGGSPPPPPLTINAAQDAAQLMVGQRARISLAHSGGSSWRLTRAGDVRSVRLVDEITGPRRDTWVLLGVMPGQVKVIFTALSPQGIPGTTRSVVLRVVPATAAALER